MQFEIIGSAAAASYPQYIPPPASDAVLSEIVQFTIDGEALFQYTIAPPNSALLPEIVQF